MIMKMIMIMKIKNKQKKKCSQQNLKNIFKNI